MDAITAATSVDDRLYANTGSKVQSRMPKAASLPIVQAYGSPEPHHYATPPSEQPRDAGSEIQDYPPTVAAKRILLTSVNQGKELRFAWAALIIQTFLSAALLILGAYHVIVAHSDVEDAPNTLLSEPVAAAPAPAVSLYYEAVSILQLALITLFTGGLGLAAYFPHDVRQPSKMVFLLFVTLSIHMALNQISSIGEEIAHKVNNELETQPYRIAELCLLPVIIIFLAAASYPACAAFVFYKYEKQTRRLLRIMYFITNLLSLLLFSAHLLSSAVSIYRGYNGEYVSRLSATVRLSYAVCAFPASALGVFLVIGTFKPIFSGSRQIGVWASVLGAAVILVMYNSTPLLAGLFQDVRGDAFDFIYLVQYVLHCSSILAWTAIILLGAAFAYVR